MFPHELLIKYFTEENFNIILFKFPLSLQQFIHI